MTAWTDEAIESAIVTLAQPGRLEAAQRAAGSAAPQLQGILDQALAEGGWFEAHDAQVRTASEPEEPEERERRVRSLLAEETRVSMLIGVAVGLELGRILDTSRKD